jgi:hypothetical protein
MDQGDNSRGFMQLAPIAHRMPDSATACPDASSSEAIPPHIENIKRDDRERGRTMVHAVLAVVLEYL